MKKPVLKDNPDIESIKATLKEYIDYLGSDEYHEDSTDNYEHAIFEATVQAFYGPKVWNYINEKMV
jgi:hypothetical protein